MNRSFYLIVVSVLIFIAVNSVFYFNIYQSQIEFQTDLLASQTSICGNTIELNGLNFENEATFILFSDDISQLFSNADIKDKGSKNLELFYAKYAGLINKLTIFDNLNNVYSLIRDRKGGFVSDYYESRIQTPLKKRDQVNDENGKHILTIPIFNSENEVASNLVLDVNYIGYINSVFDKYRLENTLWQWLISPEGELISTADSSIRVPQASLKRIGEDIFEENPGSLVHTITIQGKPTQVISVYYPVRLIRKNFGIVFSIKTDLFLHSIIIKIVIITFLSLIVLGLVLFLHLRVIREKSASAHGYKTSGEYLKKALGTLPLGIIIAGKDDRVNFMNHYAEGFLFSSPEAIPGQLFVRNLPLNQLIQADDTLYKKSFGPGNIIVLRNETGELKLFKREWFAEINQEVSRIIMLLNVSEIERSKKAMDVAQLAKTELLENMSHELSAPINDIQNQINKLMGGNLSGPLQGVLSELKKSKDLLVNLINATIDFSRHEPGNIILEEIPFTLSQEINLAIDSLKNIAGEKDISIIVKIRDEVPDKLVGDPFRLRQVIYNLIETAIEQTEHGRILISVEKTEQQCEQTRILFRIEDTGKSFSADSIERLIEITDSSETGLRLAVARQQVELMQGNLWLESPSSISTNPEEPGTSFCFTIDVLARESINKDFDFGQISSLKDIGCMVLSQAKETENRFSILEGMGITLNRLIYRVENLESATALIREKINAVQILIIIDSPSENGFVLASELLDQGLTEHFIIIILSSNLPAGNYLKIRRCMVDYYLDELTENKFHNDILAAHFPGIPREDLQIPPSGGTINPNLSILLAEDNLFNRKIGQALFKSLGFEIDMAINGNEAVKKVKSKKYDIIFMDLLMPEKDGLQASREIRKMGQEMPIVAITAVDTSEMKKAAFDAGINDYLLKPARMEKIREILLKSFEQKAGNN